MTTASGRLATGTRLRAAGLLLAVVALPWSGGGVSAGFGLAFVGHLLCGWRPRPVLPRMVVAGCVALAALFLASSLWSQDVARGLKETKGLWPLLGMVPCAAQVRRSARPRLYLWAWLASAAAAALWLLAWKALDPELVSRDLPVNRWRLNLALAHALGSGALLSLHADRAPARAVACVGALVAGAALALLGERAPLFLATGVLGLAALVLLLDRRQPTGRRGLALAALAISAVIALANPATRALLQRAPSETIAREDHRMTLWTAAWKTWEQAPLLGTGIGDASADIEAFVHGPLGHPDMPAVHAHSNLLQTMAGAGVLGAAAYLFFVAALLAPWLTRAGRCSPGAFPALWAWSFLVVGGLIECTVLQSYFLTPFALLYAIGTGMRETAAPRGATLAADARRVARPPRMEERG